MFYREKKMNKIEQLVSRFDFATEAFQNVINEVEYTKECMQNEIDDINLRIEDMKLTANMLQNYVVKADVTTSNFKKLLGDI